MSDSTVDRNLLFGILALQNNFISREALLVAFAVWVVDKRRPLGEILCEQGKLTQVQDELLRALTEQHILHHGNDPEQSLGAVSSVGPIRDDLRKLGDAQLEASLAVVAQQSAADSYSLASTCAWGGDGQRFRVLRPHAKGGLGEVFVAQDLELHREVALKEMQSRFADQPNNRSRFVLEAEITGGLEHPGIVPVYGLGQYADGRPYYAMRFIRGDSLAEAIARFHKADILGRDPGERSLALRKLLGRFIDVCEAIEYAHSRGILHRDLKPGNIMLDKYGETLVVDWGLAKPLGRREATSETGETTLHPSSGDSVDPTIMGSAIGSPAYMSPEQAAGRLDELGSASDVYGLGATLYCLLTGQPPMSGMDKGEVLAKVERGDFPRPQTVNLQIPAALQAICLKSMARKPADRYASPKLLAEDIVYWLADEPVACYPEPPRVRARRWVKRHPRLVVGTVATVLVTLVSLAAIASIVVRSNRTLAASKVETEQVLDFLTASFLKPNPSAGGEKLTVVELLDQAVNQLEMAFPNQQGIQAGLLNTIAKTYYGLGLYQKAIAVLRRAKEIHRIHLGENAESTLILMNDLAQAYQSAGRFDEALPLFEQSLELMKATLGPEHSHTLTLMNNLAASYRSAGRNAEAVPLIEQTLRLMQAELGLTHPDTLASMYNLSASYMSAGRMAEALPLMEYTLELMKVKLGPKHSDTLVAMNYLAASYMSAGRNAEALPLMENTLELIKVKLGPEHPSTLVAMGNLAKAYLVGKQPEKALSLFDKFIAGHLGRATPDDPTFAGLLAYVSRNLLQHRQYAAAETYLRECLTIREKTLPDDWVRFNTQSLLGGALAGQKKFQEAEPLLVEGYSGIKEREAKIPPAGKTRLAEAIQRLVDLYTAWEKPEEAAKWQGILDEDKERLSPQLESK